MANRNLDFNTDVNDVTPTMDGTSSELNAAGDIAEQAAQISANGKALAATAQTQSQFRQLDSQFRLNNADDPTNPTAVQQYQADRQKIIDANSNTVPAISMPAFQNKAIELSTQSDDLNAGWATHQQIRNGINGLQTGRVTQLNEANAAGQAYGQDPTQDLQSMLNYQQSMQTMHQFADPVIGSDKTGAFLKDFQADYAKSFVAGVAQNNPQAAAKMLQDPAITQHFTTQDIGDMTQVIQKTQKQQALAAQLSTVKNMQDTSNIVNSDGTYYQKRAQIDQGEMDGTISTKDAEVARRVLVSRSDLDAQTDTPKMAGVINSIYDLNASAATSPDDYLVGVKNVQDQVMQMQANNEITSQDAQKLNKQIGTLTSSKMSAATNTAGNEFYDANQKFNTLPPEYRGQATRALFYASHGQNMTDAQMSNQANQIMDTINKQRRGAAQSTLQNLQGSDTAFLQGLGYTPDQLAYTAQKHNMSQQQVIQMLRQNAKKPATRQVQPLDAGDDVGSTKSPNPDPGILLQGIAPEDQ